MKSVLVTGADGFLGYHVTKLLHDREISTRVLLRDDGPSKTFDAVRKLNPEVIRGGADDPATLRAACDGVDTVFHLSFALALGSGPETEKTLRAGNLEGMRNVLEAATQAGVERVVFSSSVLTVGINRRPEPLNEAADWATHRFDLPYALSRREAEREALTRPIGEGPVVVAVNPSLTMGPEDFEEKVPANRLARVMKSVRLTAPVGVGILDVRDFAEGALLAARSGQHGQRYILSGENLMLDALPDQVAAALGTSAPRLSIPLTLLRGPIALYGKVSKAPKVAGSILELLNRYAWYDTSLARIELGWQPRPLGETLVDTLTWRRRDRA